MQNPMDVSEDIEIYYDQYMATDFGTMPQAVRFIQNHLDTFSFEFTEIQLNAIPPLPLKANEE